jgi:NAD(P)-dependent dehydrogenase (short-subunit alcohol dehydrogenase family)
MYGRSKLANILFTRELARRLEGTAVTANCVHPGFVTSNFATNNGLPARIAMRLASLFRVGLTPEQGAETTIYLASSPDVAHTSGEYFVKKKAASTSAAASDMEAAQRLWQISEQMTQLELSHD